MTDCAPNSRIEPIRSCGPVRNSVTLTVLFLSLFTVLFFRPIDDIDIFLQVKQGEIILDRLSLPTVDQFTYTSNAESTSAICWLAQVIFAYLYRLGSWPYIKVFHVLLFSGSFILMARIAVSWHRSHGSSLSMFSLSFAVCLCFLVSLNNSSVRPQSIALFCFALILFIVQQNHPKVIKAMLIAAVAVILQNAHPSLSIVIACFLVYLLNECIRLVREGKSIFHTTFLYYVLLLSALQFLHPDGWNLFQASYANVVVSREWLHITEWLPPWHRDMYVIMLPFWVALLVSTCLVMYLRDRICGIDLGLFVLMTSFTLVSCRFAIFWSIVMVPILTRWIELARPDNIFSWDGRRPVMRTTPASAFAAGIAIMIFFVMVVRPPTISPMIWPEKGLKALHEACPRGKIYNTREWGSALIFYGYPNWKVHVDGRLYLFAERTFWEDYYATALGITPLDDIVNRYKPDAFFLHPAFHRHLVEQLKESGHWAELYADSLCAVYLPRKRNL